MKEKLNVLKKQPLFLIATGSMLLVIIFGLIAVMAVPRQPQVVKHFCRALERMDENGMLACIYEGSSMYGYSEHPADLLAEIDAETQTVECLIGQAWTNTSGKSVLVCMCIYEEGQLKDIRTLRLELESVRGREYIGFIMNDGSFTGGLSGVSGAEFRAVHADVDTKINAANDIKRTIRIEYNRVATEKDLERIEKALGEQEEKLERKYNTKIRYTTENEVSVLYITQTGDQKEIAQSSEVLFGGGDMNYLHDGGIFQISNMVGFQQSLYFPNLTFRQQMDGRVTYKFTFPPGTSICDVDNNRYERYEIGGRSLVLEKADQTEYLVAVAQQMNISAVCFWMAVVAFAASGSLYVYRNQLWKPVLKYFQTRKKNERKQVRVNIDLTAVFHYEAGRILKRPFLWIAIVAVITGFVFAAISSRQDVRQNELVEEFCEELQKIKSYEEEDIQEFISLTKYYNLNSPKTFVNALEALWNPQTQELKCSIGGEYLLADGKILVPVIMSVYGETEYIEDFICSVYLQETNGEMAIYSWKLGPHQESYREEIERDKIITQPADLHDKDRAFYDFKRMGISTIVCEDGTYDRMIQMVMDGDEWGAKKEEVSAFLETLVPEGATYSLDTLDGEPSEVLFEVKQEGMTLEELNEFNRHYFGSQDCYFTMAELQGENIFELYRDCSEKIDFYYFYDSGKRMQPTISYSISVEDNYVTESNRTTNEGLWVINLCESKEFEQNFIRFFEPLEMDIHTEVLEDDQFCRTVTVMLNDEFRPSEIEKLQANIQSYVLCADENFETVATVQVNCENVDGKGVFTLIQSGTPEQMAAMDFIFYKESTYSTSSICYEVLNPRMYIGAYENIKYYKLFGNDEKTVRYTMSFPKGTKMKYYEPSTNVSLPNYKPCAYEIDGTDITVNIMGTTVIMLAGGVRLNPWALGFWAMMGVAAICLILILADMQCVKNIKVLVANKMMASKEEEISRVQRGEMPQNPEEAQGEMSPDLRLENLDIEIKL